MENDIPPVALLFILSPSCSHMPHIRSVLVEYNNVVKLLFPKYEADSLFFFSSSPQDQRFTKACSHKFYVVFIFGMILFAHLASCSHCLLIHMLHSCFVCVCFVSLHKVKLLSLIYLAQKISFIHIKIYVFMNSYNYFCPCTTVKVMAQNVTTHKHPRCFLIAREHLECFLFFQLLSKIRIYKKRVYRWMNWLLRLTPKKNK